MPEAQNVYDLLWSVYREKAVSATVANVDWNIREAENVHEWTGKWPVMNVFDFINFHNSKDVDPKGWLDYSDISVAENWWATTFGIFMVCTHIRLKPGISYNKFSFYIKKYKTSALKYKDWRVELIPLERYTFDSSVNHMKKKKKVNKTAVQILFIMAVALLLIGMGML